MKAPLLAAAQFGRMLVVAVRAPRPVGRGLAYRGKGLPLERVLLDIHSGRFLGAWGVYLVDAAAVLFLGLMLTGLWMWSRRPG